MLIPGEVNLTLIENATNTIPIVIDGITTAVGYSASIDIRMQDKPTGGLLLGLTSNPAAGITLSSDGTALTIIVRITETQTDGMFDAIINNDGAYWSLKITDPSGDSLQYLKGEINYYRTPTA